jgi:Tol biopolymer transport system component
VQVTSHPGSQIHPSFSPDGQQIAFSWDGEKADNYNIYVKLVGETHALQLTTDPASDDSPVWVPGGKRIAFRRSDPHAGIYTVSALGGAEQKLSEFTSRDQMSWSPDGKWLAVSSTLEAASPPVPGAIFLLPVDGGEPRRISNPKAPAFDLNPSFSPEGEQLAYAHCLGSGSCDIYVQDLDSTNVPRGSARRVTNQGIHNSGLAWGRNGKSLIYGGSSLAGGRPYLWHVGLDGYRPPDRLDIAGAVASFPSFSAISNRLVFQRDQRDEDIWQYRVGGDTKPLIVSSLADKGPQFSPDGRKIAFESNRGGTAEEIWVAQAEGSRSVQMTHDLGRDQGSPQWSPNGGWIAFDSQGQDGHWDIYVMQESGGRPRRLTPGTWDAKVPSWSHDGKWIYFCSDRSGRQEIWRVPLGGGAEEQLTEEGGFLAYDSTDSTTLFCIKAPSSPLFAKPLSGGRERQVLDWITQRAFFPIADGIYYFGGRNEKGQYPLDFFQFSTQTNKMLANIDGPVTSGMSVSPDRTTVLFTKTAASKTNLMMIENFQ